MKTNRRDFLKALSTIPATAVLGKYAQAQTPEKSISAKQPKPKPPMPNWFGFNLLEMFTMRSSGDWREEDFKWIRDWGFNFVRLPLCFRLWIKDGDVYKIDEAMLAKLDHAVELGQKYNIHVCLNFHRAPGYSVNREFAEPFNLWKDKTALDAFCFHWQLLAKRYKGISSEKISFNLVNEPANINEKTMSRGDHEVVMRAAIKSIREISSERKIVIDGLSWCRTPADELNDFNVIHSTRAYVPMEITHYKASWVNSKNFPDPAWPGNGWDKKRLVEYAKPWAKLAKEGVGVHCGEGGCFNKTPHKVVLAWMQDVFDVLAESRIGFSLWNFRGGFGILDSGRSDVEYEDFHGHKLDRKMLDLFIRFKENKG